MIKFDLNRDNLTFIGLVVIVFLLLGQCSRNATLVDEVNRLEQEVSVGEANIMASFDSIEIVKQRNGIMIGEVSAYQMSNLQLIKTNKQLANDYSKALNLNKKLKDVNTLLKAELVEKDSIIFNGSLNSDSTFTITDSADYGDENVRYVFVNGKLVDNQISGIINIEQRVKLYLSIQDIDGKKSLKLSTKYPFEDLQLQGISLIDTELNTYRKKGRWNISAGVGIGLTPSQAGLAVSPMLGVTLGYSPKWLQF